MSTSVHKAASPPLGGRLAFERAIRRSSLPAPARHVALTIATWADVASGVIPDRFQPSLSTLAEATGMGATTVKRHLGVLETEGWLLRDRPEIARARKEHARTKYALDVPVAAVEHGPERAMPRSGEDHAMGQSGPTHGPERAKAWSAAGHKSSCSTDEVPDSPTTSPAGPVDTEPPTAPDVTDGGGGGDLRSLAAHITESLDYRGQTPTKTQQQQICDRLLAAFAAGWSMGGLAVYLHLGDAPVRSAAAVYAHRLSPEQLPAPGPSPAPPAARGGVRGPVLTGAEVEAWEDAAARAASRLDAGYRPFECPPASAYSNHGFGTGAGTDARVAGHVALTRELARREAQAHTPYSNDTWSRPATPAEAARVPWCGHTDCNETDRMRDVEDADGFKAVTQCPDCHPAVAWPA